MNAFIFSSNNKKSKSKIDEIKEMKQLNCEKTSYIIDKSIDIINLIDNADEKSKMIDFIYKFCYNLIYVAPELVIMKFHNYLRTYMQCNNIDRKYRNKIMNIIEEN